MKKIEIRTLSLRNFKGFTFALSGRGDFDVYGDNATGKTTLADAFSWLLFDKDSLGKSDFEIKSLDSQGEYLHNLEHEVEGVFIIDGAQVSLKKVYKEVWTKKRGAAKQENTGNTTEHYIDAVPVQKQLYVSKIKELFGDEDVFRLLTTPTAFPALHWTKQRALVIEVCGGDLTDAQVIESSKKLAGLPEILGNRTLEDHKKVVAARRSEINKALASIPVRIDEVHRGLPDVSGLEKQMLEMRIQDGETFLEERTAQLQGIDNGSALADLGQKLSKLQLEITGLENRYYIEEMRKVTKLKAEIDQFQPLKDAEDRTLKGLKDDIAGKRREAEQQESRLANLREAWEAAYAAEAFVDTTEDRCAVCGQALPADRVEEARAKALALFNHSRAERLADIEGKGKTEAAYLTKLKAEIEVLNEALLNRPDVGADRLATLIDEHAAAKKRAEDFTRVPGRADAIAEIAKINLQITAAKEGVAKDQASIRAEILGIKDVIGTDREKVGRFALREAGEKRIEELGAEEKKLTAEYERLEKELHLCDLFVRAKVQLLTERINSRFEFARFKLFHKQENGGINECCEITINGVPYGSGLNNAARINAGLDVCRTLSRHYGLLAPIFIDNAEAVSSLMPMDAQVVRLIVSPRDAELRVETVEKRIAA